MQTLASLLPARDARTVVRLLDATDLHRFHRYRSDAALGMYQGWSPMDVAEAAAFIKEMASVSGLKPGGWIQLGVAESESNALIGDVGLYLEPDGSSAEVGFTLCREAHALGHATRAVRTCLSLVFSTSDVGQIRAVTDTRNIASVRVLERAGFTVSATQESEFKGEICTEYVYVCRGVDA